MKRNYLVFSFTLLAILFSATVFAAEVTPIPEGGIVTQQVDQAEIQDITCEEIGLTKTLKYGNTGGQVSILQDILINSGYYTGSVTGKFDTATKSAVKMMQRAVDVKSDGVVGPMTREAMRELCVSMVAGS